MMYLIVIFIPPLYFAIRKKWGAFILNSILYGLALFCLLVFVLWFVVPFFWMLAVGHASWHLRREMMVEQAELLATKMAEKMKSTTPTPPVG